MEKYKYELKTDLSDLNLYQCGLQVCPPSHASGSVVKPYYLLHVVMEGRGVFAVDGHSHSLARGDAFLICPNQLSSYCSDAAEPWVYAWMALDGIKAEEYFKQAGLSKKSPVYTARNAAPVERALLDMVNYTKVPSYSELRLLGLTYLFLAELAANSTASPAGMESAKEAYLQKLVQYIHVNLWEKLTVSDLADYIGLDRSYLYRIFKEKLKLSPQEFILKHKLNHACELLQNTDMPICDIARSVGYDDQLAFSKLFKKKKGMSPKAFRQRQALDIGSAG